MNTLLTFCLNLRLSFVCFLKLKFSRRSVRMKTGRLHPDRREGMTDCMKYLFLMSLLLHMCGTYIVLLPS